MRAFWHLLFVWCHGRTLESSFRPPTFAQAGAIYTIVRVVRQRRELDFHFSPYRPKEITDQQTSLVPQELCRRLGVSPLPPWVGTSDPIWKRPSKWHLVQKLSLFWKLQVNQLAGTTASAAGVQLPKLLPQVLLGHVHQYPHWMGRSSLFAMARHRGEICAKLTLFAQDWRRVSKHRQSGIRCVEASADDPDPFSSWSTVET